MARKKSVERELHWEAMLNRHSDSRLSIREFCAQEGISQPSFYSWRKKLRERELTGISSRASAGGKGEPGNGRAFLPLKLQDSASRLDLIHPLGYQVRVTGEVNIHALRQVLEVLDGRGNQ